jgi:hypothetical protein
LICNANDAALLKSGPRADWPTVIGGVTNSIGADPQGFTGVYRSVKKDIVAYRSGMWVRMYDTWVL